MRETGYSSHIVCRVSVCVHVRQSRFVLQGKKDVNMK